MRLLGDTMKRLIILLFALMTTAAYGQKQSEVDSSKDITRFDNPFLLGDWYLVNPNVDNSKEDFRAIKLTLDSSYEFTINIQKKDYSTEHWVGFYTASEDQIILGLNSPNPQVYNYDSTHNLLRMNGVIFTKGLPNALAGIWSSESLSGANLTASKVNKMDLILQPDFVFTFRASSEGGQETVKKGVYYMENNHLVLLYENGEQETTYQLTQDKLTLEGEEMYALLQRVR